MDKQKSKSLFSYGVIAMFLLTFGFYSTTIMYADAVSVSTVTLTAGTVAWDVAYDKSTVGGTSTTAYIIGDNAGQSYVFKKSPVSDSITGNVTLTGSGVSNAIEFNPDNDSVYAVTDSKFYRITDTLGIVLEVASATAPFTMALVYDDVNNKLYYCTTTGFGTVNVNTLALTSLFTVAGVNPVLDCALDNVNGFMYLSGGNMVTTLNLIKVSLSSFTVVDSVDTVTSLGGVCFDDVENMVWVMDSSNARTIKYDSDLTQITTVTTGATPRHCSIVTDETARRLYTTNDGTNTVSIIDIDGNAVLFSPATCDSTILHRIDTIRLANTTNTYVTCVSNTNSIVIDDTVSTFVEPTPPTTGIDCDLPENANILICRLGGDGTLGSAGAFVIGDVSEGTGVLGIACSIGIVDCVSDPNPQTNGLGLLIFIASIFVIVGMFFRSIGGSATFQMPIFIWIMIIISLSAFFTITGLIDPIFLILSVIALIALGAPKVVGMIRGGGLGGGSTE